MALPLFPTFCLASLTFACGLSPPVYLRLATGSITPRGWLLEQLKLQAEGLSGHLDQFWPDVMSSVWIGGTQDPDLHERVPYWLNGYVPLAYLLRNAGITSLPGVRGIYHQRTSCSMLASPAADCKDVPPIEPVQQVEKYISEILRRRNLTTGWLGPDDTKDGNMYWGPSNVMLSLMQYAEAEASKAGQAEQAEQAILGHLLEMRRRMSRVHLSDWSAARWIDVVYVTLWLIARPAGSPHTAELEDLLTLLHDQGTNWDEVFKDIHSMHNVNTAQGLKSAAVEFLSSDGSKASFYRGLSKQRMKTLDAKFGLPTGMFIGDEWLPKAPTRHPSRGIELCGVVEAMFSYTTMYAAHGDVDFADRAERIAYNALPATWASPKGGDMWAHQYLQAVNEINAIKAEPHIWTHDGPMSETYGLEPNFGCCTANFNQGWPKFANAIFHTVDKHGEEGIVVSIWAPAAGTTAYGNIEVETTYPFGDDAIVKVEATSALLLYMRIPGWASEASVDGKPAAAGSMFQVPLSAGSTQVSVKFNPRIRIESSNPELGGAFSVLRGALLYSLPLGLNYTMTQQHFDESNDYEVRPTTPWAYALDANPGNPAASLTYESDGYSFPNAPFNKSAWPCRIQATVRPLPSWGEELNSASAPPASPACTAPQAHCGPPMQAVLVPHGGTVLRMGELPLSGLPYAQIVV